MSTQETAQAYAELLAYKQKLIKQARDIDKSPNRHKAKNWAKVEKLITEIESVNKQLKYMSELDLKAQQDG